MNELTQQLLPTGPAVVIWMALVGACIGSFLNVVVYRWPAGKSIVHPGSHCPRCGHAIRGHDNIPVVSWLILRGRCRDCRAAISLRYLLVEATASLLFALVTYAEIVRYAANLPGQMQLRAGATDVWILAAYHLCLLCGLLCAALIQWDGHAVPLRLTGLVLAVGLLAPMGAPLLKPVGVTGWTGDAVAGRSQSAAGAGLAGAAAGVLLGGLAWPAVARPIRPRDNGGPNPLHGAAVAGTFLGWQAIIVLVPLATAIHVLTSRLAGRPDDGVGRLWPAWLATGTMGYVLAWQALDRQLPGLVTEAGWPAVGVACLTTGGVSLLAWTASTPADRTRTRRVRFARRRRR